ncbi:uncharacterized protein LOC121508720 [Cheilinus undulatus]|uniref:uncharacterized protein LOC121508720 n=1 Tax=Cheilinus undulatus TaxID=241271 RepID=UPI001BD29C30|nr:uncharacterized protein LOC121508720 [Cheilinus undulatus]XP_041641688.1 uncharacterized protein LOC121508720 [Cheilinus undulatus]
MDGRWMTVMLVIIVSNGCSAVVDQNQLAQLMKGITHHYSIRGMYSLALSIKSEDPVNLQNIFQCNPKEEVQRVISDEQVYRGYRLSVAQVKKPEHAEYRLLNGLQLDSQDGDLLVLFSYASPCPSTCTNSRNRYNIFNLIGNLINSGRWSKHVFVFEKIFKPQNSQGINKSKLIQAIVKLGNSGIGLENIYRCYKPQTPNSNFQCTSCSVGGVVANECVNYNAK